MDTLVGWYSGTGCKTVLTYCPQPLQEVRERGTVRQTERAYRLIKFLPSNDDPRVRLGPYRIRKNNPLPREIVFPENCCCPRLLAR